MKLQQIIREVTYDTRGRVFSQKYTLIDPAADRTKPYVFFKYGDIYHDSLPRKSAYFDSAELAQEFIIKKKRVLKKKIQEKEASINTAPPATFSKQQQLDDQRLKRAYLNAEIFERTRIVSVTVKYEN